MTAHTSYATSAPWLVLPFRSLNEGKQRLAGFLSARERHDLNFGMLRSSLRLARSFPGIARTIVVTRCTAARAFAQMCGAHAVLQGGHGLDDAVCLGVAVAAEHGAEDVLVVSCDLPLARSANLRRLFDTGRTRGGVVLASDLAGQGTNALYLPRTAAMEFAYGPGSRSRHARAASIVQLSFHVLDDACLAFDVDTPADYLAWRVKRGAQCTISRLSDRG